ncbi:MAG TPA: hypothetical protein IGS17_08695 [Oscillatoriales cyanobacterium M59_W2019_021]|nr:hypothetical protein [Oscillatoriales cyanobacterium M4454_W2019_049]HIK50987.1 hypothetical protein [Oscillatoriales cyanobacterium M59_W2019_021]
MVTSSSDIDEILSESGGNEKSRGSGGESNPDIFIRVTQTLPQVRVDGRLLNADRETHQTNPRSLSRNSYLCRVPDDRLNDIL